MTTDLALTLTVPGRCRADMFFDRSLVATDWDQMRASIARGEITSAGVLAFIKQIEPMAEEDSRDFEHWRQQQVLRLCLLHEAGKPLESDKTCEVCAARKVDVIHDYTQDCLHCREESQQLFHGGSRGNCEFIRPHYNPRTKCWGLLYYWSHGHDDTFLFWLVDFFKTRKEAHMALQPVKHYTDWLNVKYNGMIQHWIHFREILDIEEVMKLNLPLTPEQFREVIRSKIEAGMSQEWNVMAYCVRDALSEHDREERE